VSNVFDHQRSNNRLVKKRIITKSGVSTFIEKLQSELCDNIMNNTDVNESFNLILNTFLIIFESCFPVQYVTNNVSNNQWITNGIRISCKRKNYLYMMSKITNCLKFKEYYVRYCALLRKVIRKAKEMYYNEMLTSSTNKPKTAWKIIDKEIGHVYDKKFSQTEFRNGKETINVKKAAKSFNTYFINSVDKLITQYPKNESAILSLREAFPYDFPQIISIPITVAEVICSISSLKNKNSNGCDGLSSKILKLCGNQISKPLTCFNAVNWN
jgi:hypothetical protein